MKDTISISYDEILEFLNNSSKYVKSFRPLYVNKYNDLNDFCKTVDTFRTNYEDIIDLYKELKLKISELSIVIIDNSEINDPNFINKNIYNITKDIRSDYDRIRKSLSTITLNYYLFLSNKDKLYVEELSKLCNNVYTYFYNKDLVDYKSEKLDKLSTKLSNIVRNKNNTDKEKLYKNRIINKTKNEVSNLSDELLKVLEKRKLRNKG